MKMICVKIINKREGKPCKRCGSTTHYTSGGCVRCTKARANKRRGTIAADDPINVANLLPPRKIVRPKLAPGITLKMIMAGR